VQEHAEESWLGSASSVPKDALGRASTKLQPMGNVMVQKERGSRGSLASIAIKTAFVPCNFDHFCDWGWLVAVLDHFADFTAVACLASTLSNSAQASGESSSLGGTNCQKSGKYASHSLKILAPFVLPVFST
jgi:hypothetical protein